MNVEKLDEKIGAALGGDRQGRPITDVKVNPASGNMYLAVSPRHGAGTPAIVKVTRDGKLSSRRR